MTTWKPDSPLTKNMLKLEQLTLDKRPVWPGIEYFEQARADAANEKRLRLRRRYWREKGLYLCKCVARGMRALNG